MESRYVSRRGTGTYSESVLDKASGQVVSQSENVSFPTNSTESFTVYAQSNGDHKSPTTNSWEKVLTRRMNGSTSQRLDFGSSFVDVSESGDLDIDPSGWSFDSDLWDLAYNQALSKLAEKVRSDVDLAVDIAQAGQVQRMIRDSLRLVSYVRRHPVDALRRAYRDYRNFPRKLGGKWLEFQYGWKPLAQSLYGSAVHVMQSPPHLMRLKTHASEQSDLSLIESSAENYVHTSLGHLEQRCQIAVQMTHGTNASQLLGEFSSLNPVSIAWEMTPYSFVVDWFLDVGGYIRGVETASLYGSQFLSGWVTLTGLINSRDTVVQSWSSGDTTKYQDLSGSFSRRYKSRSVLAGYPFPRPPRFKMDLGSGRLLNAAALLSQHLRVR